MRVLEIVKGLDIGSLHGGAERFAVDLSISLLRKQEDVRLCAFFSTNTTIEEQWKSLIQSKGVRCFTTADWGGHKNFANYIAGIRKLIDEIKGSPVDICHSHFQLGTLAALILKAKGLTKRVVRTAHVTREWEPGIYGWVGENIFSKWVFPMVVDSEIGVSNEITKHLESNPGAKFFNRKPKCIHNAIPDEYSLTNRSEPLPSRKPDHKLIAVIGRLSEEKGHRYLIEAVKLLFDWREKIELWIIGDGKLRGQLQSLVGMYGLDQIVHFLGPRADIGNILPNVDLVVVPSLREGFPSVILESYKFGIAVVGTDVSGINELIIPNETGRLVPSANARLLANEIKIALMDNESRDKFIKAGRAIALEHSINQISDQYIELFQKILKE